MRTTWIIAFTATLLLCGVARAELGGNVSTIQADQTKLKATLRTQTINNTNANYSMHEMITDIGTTAREYSNERGTVFAVTWTGPTKPDLHQLLGHYFNTFVTAAYARKNRTVADPVVVNQSDLVLHSGGHMRAFYGRAYVPSLVPEGVAIDALQ